MKEMAIEVIVACKNDVVRSGLRRLLDAQEDILVVGEAFDLTGAEGLVVTYRPGILVAELSLIAQNRYVDIEDVIGSWPSTKVIIFSLRRNREYVEHCLGAGARGYILAELLGAEIVDAVRDVQNGGYFLSSRLAAGTAAPSSRIPAGS